MLSKTEETLQYIRSRTRLEPRLGVILGSGLGDFVKEISIETEIPYGDLPHFPVSTVAGHEGKLIFGHIAGRAVVAMQGRFHYYEGYPMPQVVYPIRVLRGLGVDTLFLSNASGGVNPSFEVGDLMIITDHINLMGNNPLIGPNEDQLGPRFPDMSNPYDPALVRMAAEESQKLELKIHRGVYAAVTGPVYETPAEYRMIRILGADAVGMSTVPENIAARHLGMRVFALSVITDLGVEGRIREISHEEVVRAARAAEPRLASLVLALIRRLDA